jgi:hypothetical protein
LRPIFDLLELNVNSVLVECQRPIQKSKTWNKSKNEYREIESCCGTNITKEFMGCKKYALNVADYKGKILCHFLSLRCVHSYL